MKVFRGIIRAFIAFVIYMIVVVVLPSNLPTPIVIIEIAMFPMSPIIGYFFPDICRVVYKWYKEEKSAYDFSKEQWQNSAPKEIEQPEQVQGIVQSEQIEEQISVQPIELLDVHSENVAEPAPIDFQSAAKQWSKFLSDMETVFENAKHPWRSACSDGVPTTIAQELYNIDNLQGHKFENWCAELLLMNGFEEATVTKGSNDGGGDIVAVKDGTRYAIQCKRYAAKVNNQAVGQALAAMGIYSCTVAVVMTNNYFMPSAKASAVANNVLLWDRDTIIQFMKNSGHFVEPDSVAQDEQANDQRADDEEWESRLAFFDNVSRRTVPEPSQPKQQRELTYYEKKAIESAKDYDFMNFSMSGLVEQLVHDGFTKEQAEFAAAYIAGDNSSQLNGESTKKYSIYQKQAIDKSMELLEDYHLSKSELISKLTKIYGFTLEQAMFAADEIDKM